MNIDNRDRTNRFWKYDLRNECLAAAASGMHPITALDERCIVFTIHLTNENWHEPLCRALFNTTENFYSSQDRKLKSATYSGLASFIDVNGTKFSGADRDPTQIHCHGLILVPFNDEKNQITDLIADLESTAMKASTGGISFIKKFPGSIQLKKLDRLLPNSSLQNWVAYAQKEAVGIDATGEFAVILPFDCRQDYGRYKASKMEAKRDQVLQLLRSPESFKVYKKPHIMK